MDTPLPSASRRGFIQAASATALASLAAASLSAAPTPPPRLKILGISCSPRAGMTTAKAVQAALDAAKAVDARLDVEFIDLGGLAIAGYSPKPVTDDFTRILPKLQDPNVAGLILGSPSYFRGLSSLCKAFIERCAPLREPKMLLANKPIGAIATGGFRNGGQELVLQEIATAMLCFGMVPVGGRPPAFLGGTLVATKDAVDTDELGLATARRTGARVAELALRLAGSAS